MRLFTIFSALALNASAVAYYDMPATVHIEKSGEALLEVNGHYYEVRLGEHSDKCPCYEDSL